MSSRCKTFSPSSVGASTRKGTWWGCSARPAFGRASPNGSSLGASSCQQISSRRWRPCPGKTVGDGSPIARSLGARDRDLRRGHAGHISPRAAVAVVDRTGARSEEHTSELQSQSNLVCRLLLEKKKKKRKDRRYFQCTYGTSRSPAA